MMRSVYYPMICMAVSAIVLIQLLGAIGSVMQRAGSIPAVLSQTMK